MGSPKAVPPKNAKEKKNENPTAEKPTIGEELWSVHLHRGDKPSEDDLDRDALPHRERSRSVGEELWEVHLNRSKGMEPDLDVETAEGSSSSTTKPRKATTKVKPAKKPERCSARLTMHLRNRDVKKMLIR